MNYKDYLLRFVHIIRLMILAGIVLLLFPLFYIGDILSLEVWSFITRWYDKLISYTTNEFKILGIDVK